MVRHASKTVPPEAFPGASHPGSGLSPMRRNTTLGIGLALVVASSGVGWAAGRQIKSPAEIAARTAPPTPSLISVPVEKRTLSSDVVARGTVRYGAPQLVSLATSGLKRASGIVTTAPVRGTTVSEGSVAMAVSGRPVFVLQGAQPFYRDLGRWARPGATSRPSSSSRARRWGWWAGSWALPWGRWSSLAWPPAEAGRRSLKGGYR